VYGTYCNRQDEFLAEVMYATSLADLGPVACLRVATEGLKVLRKGFRRPRKT
jgi:hypothetical protein